MESKEINKVIAEEMKGPVCCPMIHEIARTIAICNQKGGVGKDKKSPVRGIHKRYHNTV